MTVADKTPVSKFGVISDDGTKNFILNVWDTNDFSIVIKQIESDDICLDNSDIQKLKRFFTYMEWYSE